MAKLLGYILAVVALVALLVPFSILNGWVLSWLWLWFIVPLGVPAIGVAHSIGLASTVGFITKQHIPSSTNPEDKYERLAYGILLPFFALIIGYVVQGFM